MESDSRAWASLQAALEAIAEWHVLRARPELAAVATPSADAPALVHAAWATITNLAASELLAATPVLSASELFDRELSGKGSRAIDILRMRVFADIPKTLDELGARFALTRERVRQIEGRVIGELRASPRLNPVYELGSNALGEELLVAPLDRILGENPALTQCVVRVSQPLWRVLDRIDDSFEVADGWWCRDSVKSAIARTRSHLKEAAGDQRSIRVADVPMFKDAPWAEDWVAYCGVKLHEGYALLVSPGISDRAAVSLESEGSPMSGEQVASRLGLDRSLRSVKNALASDDRFVRVDRNSWALASWGLAEYQSIRNLIADEVANHGGAIRLSKLVAGITERYSVSPTSVMAYASSPPFVTADGVVEMATANHSVPRKSPYDTRRLFQLSNGWGYRFAVTAEHIRGSGSPLPGALITVLGIDYGETRYLPCRIGDQALGYNGPQLTLGSIKRFVDIDDLALGDTCFALFAPDGSFDVRPVTVSATPGRQRAFALSGLTLMEGVPGLGDLASTVGLTFASTRRQVEERLRSRGDYDLADCMVSDAWS